jgi:hypothetical protein
VPTALCLPPPLLWAAATPPSRYVCAACVPAHTCCTNLGLTPHRPSVAPPARPRQQQARHRLPCPWPRPRRGRRLRRRVPVRCCSPWCLGSGDKEPRWVVRWRGWGSEVLGQGFPHLSGPWFFSLAHYPRLPRVAATHAATGWVVSPPTSAWPRWQRLAGVKGRVCGGVGSRVWPASETALYLFRHRLRGRTRARRPGGASLAQCGHQQAGALHAPALVLREATVSRLRRSCEPPLRGN